jgi:hypothetical protein
MLFRTFIKRVPIQDTPEGDFIADARADKTLPNAKSWNELQDYLSRRGACPKAIEAAQKVWDFYATRHIKSAL